VLPLNPQEQPSLLGQCIFAGALGQQCLVRGSVIAVLGLAVKLDNYPPGRIGEVGPEQTGPGGQLILRLEAVDSEGFQEQPGPGFAGRFRSPVQGVQHCRCPSVPALNLTFLEHHPHLR
jgi:hypothetical protein